MSNAMPRQSNPGPRLAVVAGASIVIRLSVISGVESGADFACYVRNSL